MSGCGTVLMTTLNDTHKYLLSDSIHLHISFCLPENHEPSSAYYILLVIHGLPEIVSSYRILTVMQSKSSTLYAGLSFDTAQI